jgi:hypothetical protein
MLFPLCSLRLVFCFDRTESLVKAHPTHPQRTKHKEPKTNSHSQTVHNDKSRSAASKASKGAAQTHAKTGPEFRVSFKGFNDSKGAAHKTAPPEIERLTATHGERFPNTEIK